MHTLNRILTVLLLGAVLLPPASFALVSLDQKSVAQESLQHAIGTAVTRYQQRTGLEAQRRRSEEQAALLQEQLQPLERRKRELRMEVAQRRRTLEAIGEKHGIALESRAQTEALILQAQERVSWMLRTRYLRRMDDASSDVGGVVLRTLLSGETHDLVAQVNTQHQQQLYDLLIARRLFEELEVLEPEREETLEAYREAQQSYDAAAASVERTAAQLEAIKRIMAEVHEQVLKIQSELARIDARIKRRAERDLIEKGLLDPKTGGASPIVSATPRFSWPVYGRISAGFLDKGYKDYFGVPHYAIDIVVGENTPVAVAADGVVFLVRDGGETGYTYILVGHRDGYATLYGHLLSTSVTAGQDVSAGQIIGRSGGRPGTRGAGPMTTGAHLHFEVIKSGANIDPRTVLP